MVTSFIQPLYVFQYTNEVFVRNPKCWETSVPQHHNRFTALFPGPPEWAGARRELLDFMLQGKTNRGRHTDHPAGHHSIQTKQCPPPPSPIFYRPDALPATQPTVSKHWRQLAHSDYGQDARVLLNSVTCTVSITRDISVITAKCNVWKKSLSKAQGGNTHHFVDLKLWRDENEIQRFLVNHLYHKLQFNTTTTKQFIRKLSLY